MSSTLSSCCRQCAADNVTFIFELTGLVDVEDYLLACQRYIELNPVRAGMVAVPEDYSWSSYKANGFGKQMKLWTPHRVYLDLGATIRERAAACRELFAGHIDERLVRQIRQATNRGMVLGKGGI